MAKPAKKRTTKKAAKPAATPKAAEVVDQPIAEKQSPEQDNAQLTIADLQAIAQVIDMACRRGAFGAGEVGDVGIIYGKLANFLKIISDQKKTAEGVNNG